MADFKWYLYCDTPGWKEVTSSGTIVFSGTSTGIGDAITVDAYQDGTHLGTGDPGSDQCGSNHANNVKYISNTQFDGGTGTETLNDTNLTASECTLQVTFTDASSVAITNGRFYSFNGAATQTEAVGVDVYAFEQGVGASSWTHINDDSGDIGGDNVGEVLSLTNQSAETEHTYYIAVSAAPESVGGKTQFDFGIALTYS